MSKKENLIKVALTAARPGRVTYDRRVIYASFYRGVPVRAPSPGINIAGYQYSPNELIPANVIMLADRAERDKLFALIDQDKKAQQESRRPGPGQINFIQQQEKDQDTLDRERRENALAFLPPNVIASRGHDSQYQSNYEAMYDWMMDYFRDWYKNLSSDQELQAKSFGRRIKIAGEMNPYLRGDRTRTYDHTSQAIEEGIHVFDSLVDNAPPIDQDLIVYRGIPDTRSLVPVGTNLKKGEMISNNQFMSSTIDPSVAADGFMSSSSSNKLLMRILLPKGTRTAPVTTWNMDQEGTSRTSFTSGGGSHEMEFTLPRDSKLRIVTEPHEEDFQKSGTIRSIRVADFELVPQPTPEESPKLPHQEINSFNTGGRKDFYDDNDDDVTFDDMDSDRDPWDGYDPDDMKSDKASDLEKIIDNYEEDPGHDAEALEQIKNLKFDLDTIDHTDYSDPDEYDQVMAEIISQAEGMVSDAPDNTDELWDNFNPRREQAQFLDQLDGVISQFARNHDLSRPVIADYLKQLKSIREQISGPLFLENLRDLYTYPDEYSDTLRKYLLKARTLADLGHEIDQDQISGQPPLFLGQEATYSELENWLDRKKSFDQDVIKIREFDLDLANRVQTLWDKATHGIGQDSELRTLMNHLDTASHKYAAGAPPDYSGYNYPSISDLSRQVDHQVLVNKSIQNNIARAKSLGIFQGSDVPETSLKEWAKKTYEFRKNLDEYRKKQEAAGNPVISHAAQAQIYWDRATRELLPTYETMALLTRLVDYSEALKEGYVLDPDYGINDIKSRLNTELVKQGSPSAKLGARLDQLNDRYREANERFVNSHYYDEKHKGYLEKFKNYIKSKGVNGTELEHIQMLPPEIQEQIFTQANSLIVNLAKAASGYMDPAQIWPQPAEEIQAQAPAMSSGSTAIAKLRHKVSQKKILSDYADMISEYKKIPEYNDDYHKQLNTLMKQALENYTGSGQLAAMNEVVRRTIDLANQTPSSSENLYLPLPEARPAPTKFLTTHFMDKQDWKLLYYKKLNELREAIQKYALKPEYSAKQHADLISGFNMGENSDAVIEKLQQGTPESNQAIIDNFDNIITHAKTLAGLTGPPAEIKTPSQAIQFVDKLHDFEDTIHTNSLTSDTNVGLYDEFWMNKLPSVIKSNFNKGTPEQKQAILDHMDSVIAKAKTPTTPTAEPSHIPKSLADWHNLADWHDLFKQKRQEFKTLMEEYINSPEYNQSIHKDMGQSFWKKTLPSIFESQYLHASPEGKQATLDHMDSVIARAKDLFTQDKTLPESQNWVDQFHKVIQKAQQATSTETVPIPANSSVYSDYVNNSKDHPMPDWQAMYDKTMGQAQENEDIPESPSKPDKSFEDTFSLADEITYRLHNYEDMPLSSREKLGELGDRYNELRDRWYKNPNSNTHILEQLTHLYNDVSREDDEHSGKLVKIAGHSSDIQPQLASGPSLKELEDKFPAQTSQIHLDMANYKNSPHFDPMSYGLMVDLVDHVAYDWEKKKDPEDTHDELKDIMKITKKNITDNGKLPHESIMPAAPKPLFESAPSPKPSGNSLSRKLYSRLSGQAKKTFTSNKVTLNKVIRKIYSRDETESEPLDFTPHTHAFGTNPELDQPYYQRIYEFHMGHYGDFLDTLSDPEKKMLGLNRPVKIANMGAYLRGRVAKIQPEQEKLLQAGIRTMDGIISRSPPTPRDMILYRGMGGYDLTRVSPGTMIHDPGFPSTSLNALISASGFSKNGHILRVRAPQSSWMAPISASQVQDFGYQPHKTDFHNMEHELVLGRNHTFKITGTLQHDPKNRFYFLNADLLPPGPVTGEHYKPWGVSS